MDTPLLVTVITYLILGGLAYEADARIARSFKSADDSACPWCARKVAQLHLNRAIERDHPRFYTALNVISMIVTVAIWPFVLIVCTRAALHRRRNHLITTTTPQKDDT